MKEDVRIHLIHYLVLVAILTIGLGSLLVFSYDRNLQFLIGGATALAYFFWGIIHHRLEDNIHLKVVVEYMLVAAIATLILFILLWRSL